MDPLLLSEWTVAVIVIDVFKLLWPVVIVDAAVWVDFGEALALGVDFEAVEVTCGETPGVDILAIVAGFTVGAVTFFGSPEVTNGFAVLLLTSLVWLEAICTVTFSVTLTLEVSRGTERFPLGEP